MTLWSGSGVTVNRLRLSPRGGDPLSLRLRANRSVVQSLTRPSGLPPSAILCVRRLADPQPHTLDLNRDHLPPPEWCAAVSTSLAGLAARAARPFNGEVRADAEAVVFADWAELLACLAADACRGQLHARWWWPALIGEGDLYRRAVKVWVGAPRYVAPALDALDRHGWGARFVATLTELETAELLRMTLEARGLPTSSVPPRLLHSTAASRHASPRLAPWRPWVSDRQCAGLRLDQERLLGVSVAIRRAPTHLVTAAFVEAALAWVRPSEGSSPVAAPDAGVARVATASVHVPPPLVDVIKSGASPQELRPTSRESPEERGERGVQAPLARVSDSTDPSDIEPVSQHVDLPTPRNGVEAEAAPATATGVHSTTYGGIFFLLNLGLRLGLYGDFTTPAQPGIALPIWDFVSIVGRRLTGPGAAADPIWRLLAGLSGRRPGESPGTGFDPPRAWRIDADWLRPFPDRRTWHWSASSGRLRVRHPAGFLVLDVSRSGDEPVAQQLERELAPYRAGARLRVVRRRQRDDNARPSSPLAAWTAWLLPYVRARLGAAMQRRAPRTTGPLLCRQLARVVVTPAHVHVTFALDALPIDVRLSGLDRDPGWIPAAGRVVTFAFE